MALRIDRSKPEQMKIHFTWSNPEPAGPISVVGSFNQWLAGLDELYIVGGQGERSVVLGLPYGETFVFRYLASDGRWFDEPDADEIAPYGSVLYPRTPVEHVPSDN